MTAANPGTARTCGYCSGPLPATARIDRLYCSTDCRRRAWDDNNPSPRSGGHPDDGGPWHRTMAGWRPSVPLHWHRGDHVSGLHGIPELGYWRRFGCPPRCDIPVVPPGWSIGVREGRESAGPEIPPEYADQVTADNWMSIADPADYGEPSRTRRAAGELISIARHRAVH